MIARSIMPHTDFHGSRLASRARTGGSITSQRLLRVSWCELKLAGTTQFATLIFSKLNDDPET